ncbi:MAG: 30S ribosomal protein S24e [Candidatus Thermoplasmatota archaeon]
MEIEILHQRENHLLSRIEVEFKVVHQGEATPKREAVRDEISRHLKAQKERVIVGHLDTGFGAGLSQGHARIYKSKDDALRTEPKHILIRNGLLKKEETVKKEGKKEG